MKFLRNIRKSRPSSDEIFYAQIKKLLGFPPKNIKPYQHAFTHTSLQKKDKNGYPVNYERLEYLGDAMLGSVIASYLFNEVPGADEGYLTKMRSKIVSREHLNELGRDLNLLRYLESKNSKKKLGTNIHGNLFEALIGAIYLDRGYTYCEKFISKKVITPYVDIAKLEGKITSYKSLIIEWSQKTKQKIKFDTYEDSGNQSTKYFSVKLFLEEKVISKGRATSKKRAEELAAKRAYYSLQSKINN